MQVAQNVPTSLEKLQNYFSHNRRFFRRGVIKESGLKSTAKAFSSVIVKYANSKTIFEDKQEKQKKFNFCN